MSCAGYIDDLVRDAVTWIPETQNPHGSWGHYLPTAEETADCLQSRAIWMLHEGQVPSDVVNRGAGWLMDHTRTLFRTLSRTFSGRLLVIM